MRNLPRPIISALLFFLVCGAAISISAQSGNPSLASVLNADGSIDPSVAGSFDSRDYRLTAGANGEPRFIAQRAAGGCVPGDAWDTEFSMNGSDNYIEAVASDGAGNVYI